MPTTLLPYAEVLVPVDFTTLGWQVLPLAEQLAAAFGTPVRVMHVDTSSPWSGDDSSRLWLRARPFDRAVDVDVIADPDVALGIARIVLDRDVLVVMSAHGRTAAAELLLVSNTEGILRTLDATVVVAGPSFREAQLPLQRIVCCVDGDEPPPALLTDLERMGRQLDIGVRFVTVVASPGRDRTDLMAHHERLVDSLADRFSSAGLPALSVVLRGNRPGHELTSYANSEPGTLVAVSTHARTVPGRALLGSVAMKVVRHAHGPVLVRHRHT